MNQKKYNNYLDEQDERDFRRYKLDEDSEFQSREEAKNIIKAFIQTENDAEEIKSRAQNKKPQYWKEQKDNQAGKQQGSNTKLDQDIELALELINKRKEATKKPTTDDVVLNMELRHAKIKQMKEDRIKQKQEGKAKYQSMNLFTEQARFEAHKGRPPSANTQNRSSFKGNGSLQSSSQKGSMHDWDNSSQQSRPSSRQLQQSQQNFQNSRQTIQTQSQASINNQIQNDSNVTDLSQQNKSLNPKNEIQVLKNKRQNLEMQSRKMEEDMKQMKENLRKELFQNNDASMISNRNGQQQNINDTIDYLQKEADESRMKYNQFRLQKLVKAYNYVLKRYKRLFYNQVFEALKQKNREYQRQEHQCVNIMRLKKLFIVFSSWKKYVYSQKDEKDVKFYLQEKIHENTFLNRAGEYYKRRLIRICMRHWKKYWKICKQEKILDEEKNGLKYKIKGFISNLKQNIQQSEIEAQNQKDVQKQRVVEQFLRLNAAQSQNQQDINEEFEDQQEEGYEVSQQLNQNNQINHKKPENITANKQPQNTKQNPQRNNLRLSTTSQKSQASDNQPTRDLPKNQEKSPKMVIKKNEQSNKEMKSTPQKQQNIQKNNRIPIQQSPQPQSNTKYMAQKNVSPESQYSDQKQYQQNYDEQEDQSYEQEYNDQENQYNYNDDYYDDDEENEGQQSIVTDIARSRAPIPQQSERNDQMTFRQNQLSKSPNQRQDSKGHSESLMSAQTNKDKEREEKLKQIQQRNEDRKKKVEEFRKKHEELRKQKEEEKKRKEEEEIEKERQKRKEEYENYQQKRKEEKEKKEKIEKDKQQMIEKLALAKSHHQKSIAKYYGFRPWTKFMELQDHLIVVANQFDYMRILKKGLFFLAEATQLSKKCFQQEMEFKEEQAKLHYHLTILKKGFQLIQNFSEQSRADAEVYRQQRMDYLKRTVFYKWNDVLSVLRNENVAFEEQYKQIIVQFRKVVLCERAFRSWKQCSEEEKIERLKNKQKTDLRNKANQWLSEFKSSSSNNNHNNNNGNQGDNINNQNVNNKDLEGNTLSDELRNSNFEDINKSQIKNLALKKFYDKRNQLIQNMENRDNNISEQPMQHEESQDLERNHQNEYSEEEEEKEDNDNMQNEHEFYEDDFEQYSENKNNYQKNQNQNESDDGEDDCQNGYQSLSQQHKNLRALNQNKNYDLPLVQVLQNTNELTQKLARNNSRSNKDNQNE